MLGDEASSLWPSWQLYAYKPQGTFGDDGKFAKDPLPLIGTAPTSATILELARAACESDVRSAQAKVKQSEREQAEFWRNEALLRQRERDEEWKNALHYRNRAQVASLDGVGNGPGSLVQVRRSDEKRCTS